MTLEQRIEALENKLASYGNGQFIIEGGQIFITAADGTVLSRMRYITDNEPEKAAADKAAVGTCNNSYDAGFMMRVESSLDEIISNALLPAKE